VGRSEEGGYEQLGWQKSKWYILFLQTKSSELFIDLDVSKVSYGARAHFEKVVGGAMCLSQYGDIATALHLTIVTTLSDSVAMPSIVRAILE
jgi:hypothetical protein